MASLRLRISDSAPAIFARCFPRFRVRVAIGRSRQSVPRASKRTDTALRDRDLQLPHRATSSRAADAGGPAQLRCRVVFIQSRLPMPALSVLCRLGVDLPRGARPPCGVNGQPVFIISLMSYSRRDFTMAVS